MKKAKETKLDVEWVSLLKEAKEMGLSPVEVRNYLALSKKIILKERV
ncbi:anti-repressor SinI family protein [Halobacillus massiliensis]|nr:anti-repressor SinI family protein [Halobacillus massiliensis]